MTSRTGPCGICLPSSRRLMGFEVACSTHSITEGDDCGPRTGVCTTLYSYAVHTAGAPRRRETVTTREPPSLAKNFRNEDPALGFAA